MAMTKKMNPFRIDLLVFSRTRSSIGGGFLLDLTYEEDALAEVDMNFVVTGGGSFVEIQGTAEESSFTKQEMDEMTELASKGVRELVRIQRRVLGWSP